MAHFARATMSTFGRERKGTFVIQLVRSHSLFRLHELYGLINELADG